MSPSQGSARAGGLSSGFLRVYWTAWVAVAAAYMTIFVIQGASPGPAFADVLINTGSAALLGRIVLWWHARGSESHEDRTGWWLILVRSTEASVFSVVWLLAIAIGFTVRGWLGTGTLEWTSLRGAAVPWQLFAGVMVYAAVAASSAAAGASARLREQTRRLDRAEALQHRAQLESLRARLQPHFLFNTLHSVRAQVLYDPEEAVRSLDDFAALLRHSLRVTRDGRTETTLEEEWAVSERYLRLEGLRLGDRLRVEVHIPPETLDHPVPAFLLQPLLENAIHHAVAPRSAGGTVRVSAGMEEAALQLMVSDDGPGATEPFQGFLTGNRAADSVDSSPLLRGIGMRSVCDRLELLFPGQDTLHVSTKPGEGFDVMVRIPAQTGVRQPPPGSLVEAP